MWTEIISVCKELMQHYFNSKKEDKEKLAKLFSSISEILQETSIKLSNDEYPHYHCSIMNSLSQELIMYCTGVIEDNKTIKFTDMLLECSKLEREYANRQDPNSIKTLMVSAGEFKSLSMLLGE